MPNNTTRAGGYAAKAACWHKTSLDIAAPDLADDTHPFVEWLFARGNTHEAEVFADIVARGANVAVVTEVRGADGQRTAAGAAAAAETDTFRALYSDRADIVLGGRIGPVFEQLLCAHRGDPAAELDPDRVSQPDMLVVAGRDDRGTPEALLPVDVKWHHDTRGDAARPGSVADPADPLAVTDTTVEGSGRSEDLLQLAHYWRHLNQIGLTSDLPAQGGIIGTDARLVWFDLEGTTVTHPVDPGVKIGALDGYDAGLAHYRVVSRAAASVAAGDDGAALATEPRYDAGTCSTCPFFRQVCGPRLEFGWPGGHTTLLPGVTPRRAEAYAGIGAQSVLALAALDPLDAAADLEGTAVARRCATDIAQARVALKREVCLRPGFAAIGLDRADVEVDFDLENTPDGTVYLWGASDTYTTPKGARARKVTETHRFADWSGTPAGEAKTFADFWAYLSATRAKAHAEGLTWRAYHYSHHERTMAVKLAQRHAGVTGVPTVEEVEQLFDSEATVDLYAVVRRLMWPTRSMSLKDVAKYARHRWASAGADGAASLAWYDEAVGSGPDAEQYRAKLLEYVGDDVAAQLKVRDFLDTLPPRLAAAETLAAPALV